jgi:plastocyanin
MLRREPLPETNIWINVAFQINIFWEVESDSGQLNKADREFRIGHGKTSPTTLCRSVLCDAVLDGRTVAKSDIRYVGEWPVSSAAAHAITRKFGAIRKKMRRFLSTKVPFSTELPPWLVAEARETSHDLVRVTNELRSARRVNTRAQVMHTLSNMTVTKSSNCRWIALVGLLVVLVLTACGSSSSAPAAAAGGASASSTSASGAPDTIIIKNFAFHPASLSVAPGTVVTVRNEDTVTHTVTDKADAKLFGTGDIAAGQTKTFKAPDQAGSYLYLCTIHQFMTGTLVVR